MIKHHLKPEDIVEVQYLRREGFAIRTIAKKYKVSHSTIVWHTNDEYRERRQKRGKQLYGQRKENYKLLGKHL